MKILISNSSDDPIYEQISRQIKNQIISGELKEGEALPSIRSLAKELQISVITTKHAYEILLEEGFVDSITGKGTFVSSQNQTLLREKKLKIVEEKLSEAVANAQLLGITKNEISQMLNLLYEEE
jgi:Predicted transcriptional regulators